jgi:heat shock protein HslJ
MFRTLPVLLLLAACGGKTSPTPDPPPRPAPADLVTLRGALSYDAAMALPDAAVAVVEARDAATGRTLSATRTPLRGHQVPIAFSLAVRPPGGAVVLDARIDEAGVASWQIEPVRIERPTDGLDLGVLALSPTAAAPATALRCGDDDVLLRTDGDVATVKVRGVTHRLTRTELARFEGPTGYAVTLGDAGISLSHGGATTACTEGADTPTTAPDTGLVGAAWTAFELEGAPLAPGSTITLAFATDGGLSGSASCNRFGGAWTLTGARLTTTPGGATRRACPPPIMEQEHAFFGILTRVSGFEVSPDGQLSLTAGATTVLRARR